MSETANDKDPRVKIFGEDINRPRSWRGGDPLLGLLVLFAGGVLLLNNTGAISWDFWNFVWIFWPLLLILAGIRAILGPNIISSIIIFLLSLATFGAVLVYGLKKLDSPLVSYFPPEIIEFVNLLTTNIK